MRRVMKHFSFAYSALAVSPVWIFPRHHIYNAAEDQRGKNCKNAVSKRKMIGMRGA
jgi:hypothetical protein